MPKMLILMCLILLAPLFANANDSQKSPSFAAIDGLSTAQTSAFALGAKEFKHFFTAREGLGPVYSSNACIACHASLERGPVLLQKMAIVNADDSPLPNSAAYLPWGNSVRPFAVYPASHPVSESAGFSGDIAASGGHLKLSVRMPPPLLGRGWIDAIAPDEILRVEREQALRTDRIHGQINWIILASGERAIGRFGLKARQPSLLAFTADAYLSDMGLTSRLRPIDLPNPDGLPSPAQPELKDEVVSGVAEFLQDLQVPARGPTNAQGEAIFKKIGCAVCHTPELANASDHPLFALGFKISFVYSDLLLHHMGSSNADGIADVNAMSDQWRTAPLIGLRYQPSFLHDGRATSIDDAIVKHGFDSEAGDVIQAYEALPEPERGALLDFVKSL